MTFSASPESSRSRSRPCHWSCRSPKSSTPTRGPTRAGAPAPAPRTSDLALIAELSTLDAAALHREVETIFNLRKIHTVPTTLPPPPADWATPFRRLAKEVGVPEGLRAGHRDAAALLDPILGGEVIAGRWSSRQRRWLPEKSKVR